MVSTRVATGVPPLRLPALPAGVPPSPAALRSFAAHAQPPRTHRLVTLGAAMADLFLIWYLLVLAIGLGVLYRRRTRRLTEALYSVCVAGVLATAVTSRLGGA